MKEPLGALEKRMPFIHKAICFDNGAEFLKRFHSKPIQEIVAWAV